MSGPKQALTLVSCKDGKMILHEEVAKKVLESVEAKNRPVAIISIAGMFRKGKSFFLNFVLRHLIEKTSPNLKRSKPDRLEGFEWNSSSDGVTSGITIWPEVFVGNNVAIVLIDTQGLFENGKSTAEDTYIMVLSFMFSSFQILNHHENLNSSDLKNFEFFAKYGVALESKTENIKGFQNLLFLVRDWKHESKHPYGLDGGKKYLDGIFQPDMIKELRSAHETFKHCENVECFLMPYPGHDVAHNEKFSGEIKRIESVFVENMEKLVKYLIANVKPKKVLSQEANGEQLLPVMKKYVEYINACELPEPKPLLQCQMELLQNKVETKCLSTYNDLMRDGTNEELLNKTEMDELHKQCADTAIAEFDTLADFENGEEIKTSKSKFLQFLEQNEYKLFKKSMEERVESKIKIKFEKSKNAFNTTLDDISRKSSNIANLKREATKLRDEKINDFREKTRFGDADRIENFIEPLKQLQRASLREKVEDKSGSFYNHLMHDGTDCKLLNKNKMHDLHKKYVNSIIAEFDTEAGFENEEQIKTSKSKVSKLIEENEYKNYRTTMETKVESELQKISDSSKKSFKTDLEDQIKNSKLVKNLKKVASEHQEKQIEDFTENTKFGDTDRIKVLHETLKQDTEKIYKDHESKLSEEHPIKNFFASLGGALTVSSTTGAVAGIGTAVVVTAAAAPVAIVVGVTGGLTLGVYTIVTKFFI